LHRIETPEGSADRGFLLVNKNIDNTNHVPAVTQGWTPWVSAGFALVVVIWGTTWFAIHAQLNGTAPLVSVAIRTAAASALFFLIAIARGERLRLPRETLLAALVPGMCFFGINYLAVYEGSVYLTSGIVAVLFGIAVPFNIVAEWMLAGVKPKLSSWLAAAVGMLGIGLVFSAELEAALRLEGALIGAALVVFAAAVVSVGNVLSARLVAGRISPVALNAYGSAIGACTIVLWGGLSGTDWTLNATPSWGIALAYLILIGSVLAFWIYMTVLPRIGSVAAAYQVVLSPVVALCLSAAFEGLQLGVSVFAGIALLMIGNTLLIRGRRARPIAN